MLAARNTAIMTVVGELPAAVVSDLFGIHPATVQRWTRYGQHSWADYLSARAELVAEAAPNQPSEYRTGLGRATRLEPSHNVDERAIRGRGRLPQQQRAG